MADILVAYYSRSGVTEGLARRLAERLGADIDAVRPAASYAGRAGFRRGVWHSLFRRTPDVTFDKNPADYAVVVVGSPVWAGRLSAPMRSYLKRNRGRAGPWTAFWVSGSGQPYEAVGREIAQLGGSPPQAMASFAEREVEAGAGGAELDAFVQAVGSLRRGPV